MRITLDNLKTGNRKAIYYGKKQKGTAHPMDRTLKYQAPDNKRYKLNQNDVEVALFQANNTDMRGKKDRLEFRGNHPHRWNPRAQFNQGFTDDGGSSRGGQPGVNKGKKSDYVKAYGNVKNTTRPFAESKVENYVKFKV